MSHLSRLVCLVALALGVATPAAQAVQLGASTTGNPRGVQLDISPTAGAALDTTVSGTAAGVLTVSDPGGVALSVVAGAPCTQVDANTATCGVAGDPVTYATVYGGEQDDSVDLSGLETQATSRGPLIGYPAAFDVDERARGIFINVLSAGGADDITGGGAGARYEPGDGNDTVHGGPGDEVFRAGGQPTDGADVFSGGGGFDAMSYAARTAPVSAVLGDGLTSGLGGGIPGGENDSVDGVEALMGGKSDDVLTITGRLGGLGTLYGSEGNDTLTGGPGPDKLVGGSGKDEVFGGDGDDRLVDPGRDDSFTTNAPNIAGHLNGGGGDDELVHTGTLIPLSQFADLTPTCGSGTDVLRADPGIDEGVGLYAGPADCEVLATVGIDGFDGTIDEVLRVGSTATITPSPSLLGTSLVGRIGETTWKICAGVLCEDRKTPGPQITFGAADLGKRLFSASARQIEPLSQDPRWVQERAALEPFGQPIVVAWPTGSTTIAEALPATPPVKVAEPNAAAAFKAFKAALGSKPKLKLLSKATSLKFAVPSGTKVTAKLSVKRGKNVTILSRGTATAGSNGRVTLVLKPTKAGKKAAKAGKKLKVTVEVVVASAGGGAATGGTVTLRKG